MRRSTRFALVGVAVAAAAAPAFADSVVVNASPTASTRQLKVLDMAGQPLTQVSLAPGQPDPFQVQVVDSGFSSLTSSNGFSVKASMNNLYLVNGAGYDYSAPYIPSGDLSIDYQTNPIRAFSPVADVLGSVSLSGALPTCTGGVVTGLPNLISDVTTADGVALATQLCTDLTTTALQVTSAGPVALPTATTLDLSSLLPSDLPFNLGSTLGVDYENGAFTNADYSTGTIGGDPANGNIPPNWATAPVTTKKLLTGHAALTTNLTNVINSALGAVVSGSSALSSATGAGALLPVSSVIAALNGAGGSLTTLAGDLTQIPATDAAQIVNSLTPTLLAPALANLTGVGATSVSLPTLTYSGAATVPTGQYRGTMTVTLLSS
jgi:hypothetical protein